MKVIVLLVGLGPTYGNAAGELYGSIRQVIQYTDAEQAGGESVNEVALVDSGSRFGVQGNEELRTGLIAFGRWEWGADAGEQGSGLATRLGYVGVSGNFGAISFGSQWSAWNEFVGASQMNFVNEGQWHNGTERNGRNLKYASNFNGISIEADAVFATAEGTGSLNNVDEAQIALGYTLGDVSLQGAVIGRDNNYLDGGMVYGARASYTSESVIVSAAIAHTTGVSDASLEALFGYKIRASFTQGPNDFIAVFTTSEDSDTEGERKGFSLGYQHNFSKRTRVALEMASVDPGLAGQGMTMEGGVMFRHDW